MGKEYVYQHSDDGLDLWSKLFTSRIGDGSGSPYQCYEDLLELLVELNRGKDMIDIGAGHGAAIAIAKGRVGKLIALEPDKQRYVASFGAYHEPPYCEVINQTSRDFIADNPGRKFQFVLLAMVLQHVATDNCSAIFEDISELLDEDGLALISTTHSPDDIEKFYTSTTHDNGPISREEYDDYARGLLPQTRGLPIRRFSRSDLLNEAHQHFDVLYWAPFMYFRPALLGRFAAMYNTSTEALRDCANCQLMILRKPG
ncbi:MAG: methyltransferase domain-containing protein [Pseudomonadota bacterium]